MRTKQRRIKSKYLKVGIIALAVTMLAGSSVFALKTNNDKRISDASKQTINIPELNTPDTTSKGDPVTPEVSQESAVRQQPVQQAPVIPTNDQLIAQYGYNATYINDVITAFPNMFTDQERETAFKYMNAIITGESSNYRSDYIFSHNAVSRAKMWPQDQLDALWLRFGIENGVYGDLLTHYTIKQ